MSTETIPFGHKWKQTKAERDFRLAYGKKRTHFGKTKTAIQLTPRKSMVAFRERF